MEISVLKEYLDITYEIVAILAIMTGGFWTIYKFGLFREKFPSLEITNRIDFIGENSEEYLLELSCSVVNKGNVRKWLAPLEFEILYLKDNEKFIPNTEYLNGEIEFHSFSNKHINWVDPTWHIPFIDGKSERTFSYLKAVPKDCNLFTLFTHFIDFSSKRKAVYMLRNRSRFEEEFENWAKLSMNEQIEINSKLYRKSDFYYSQYTTSISNIRGKCSSIKDVSQEPIDDSV